MNFIPASESLEAESYDMVLSAMVDPLAFSSWVAAHHPLGGCKVLDLGAGTGLCAAGFSAHVSSVTGVDVSLAALELFQTRMQELPHTVLASDFRHFVLDEDFDIIVMSRNTFFEAATISDKLAVLDRIRAHLRPRGAAFLDLTDPNEFVNLGETPQSYTLPLGQDKAVTITQTADRTLQSLLTMYIIHQHGATYAFYERATWCTLAELRLLVRLTPGLEIFTVDGDYDGSDYGPRSRSLLVGIRTVS